MSAERHPTLLDRLQIKAASRGCTGAFESLVNRHGSEAAVWRTVADLAKKGSDGACDLICRRFRRRLVAYAQSRIVEYNDKLKDSRYQLSAEQEAEDAAQEALNKACVKISTFRGEAQLSTWLHRICHNVCADRMRKNRPMLEAPPVGGGAGQPGESALDRLIDERFNEDVHLTLLAIEQILSEYPAIERETFIAVFYHGRSQVEVAEAFKVQRTTMIGWHRNIQHAIDSQMAGPCDRSAADIDRSAQRLRRSAARPSLGQADLLCGVYQCPGAAALVLSPMQAAEIPRNTNGTPGAPVSPGHPNSGNVCLRLGELIRYLEDGDDADDSHALLNGQRGARLTSFWLELDHMIPMGKHAVALVLAPSDEQVHWFSERPRWQLIKLTSHATWLSEVNAVLAATSGAEGDVVQRTMKLIASAEAFVWTCSENGAAT